uniref:Long-chain-alcohol oxidase n=1 Tax=Oryza barthii TaxID=65489 RepID=A0A0D3HEN9_9ORYZ
MAPHPLLRGGARRGRKYAHGMHPAQMEALRAMCGALIPSLPVDADGGDGGRRPGDKDLERFYLASAADSSIPDEVVWEAVALTWVVLWALSTRAGTLLLCGRDSVAAVDGGGFPFVSVRRFADMPAARREAALRRWSGARWLFFPLRIAFAIAKILCHYVFYSMVNENSENPYWKAIGYRVEEPRRDRAESMPSPSPSPASWRPLDNGVVETRALTDTTLLRSLAAKGLAVRPGASDEHHTVRCDAIIVGSGCGGGVAAAVLASAGGPMHSTTDKWSVLCSAHQMGSCRMGASPRDGAVDVAGESWEAEGLYVCDGSLLPTAVGVNPMITIQSIAYCMEALRAICGAFIPSLPEAAAALAEADDEGRGGGDKDLERFYLASAADAAVPDEVAELMVNRCAWEAVALVTVVLWLLATRAGTLALCGAAACVASSAAGGWLPSVRRFADLPPERREAALRRWSSARWLFPLKITFTVIKIICHFVFYTKISPILPSRHPGHCARRPLPVTSLFRLADATPASRRRRLAVPGPPLTGCEQRDSTLTVCTLDEKSRNPSWKAIGYAAPAAAAAAVEQRRPASPSRRPLEDGVVETRRMDDNALLRSLVEKGLAVKTGTAAHHTVQCDAVVVGSGCGGGVAAAVLASKGYKVVVVEKGDYFATEDYTSLEGPSMERLYEKGGVFGTSNVTTILFTGATVGGGSAVNWSACIRTPAEIREEWSREHGLPVFASTAYAQAMDAVCDRIRVTGGCEEEGFQNRVLRRGCDALGMRADAVPRNSSEGHFCGSCNLGCPTGDKKGTDTTWLVDAVERGAVILTGCKAEHFILERNAGGRGGRSKRCRHHQEAPLEAKVSISACGALMTPPLLRNSGLKNRHIGRNLHLHPVSMAWGYFPDSTAELPGKCYEGGIITSMHRVTDRTIIETPALGPGAFSAVVPWESGRDMKERMRRYARTAHAFALVRDRGAGAVDGEGRVRFSPSRDDAEELRAGLRRALRILVAAGAAEVGTNRSDGLRLRCKGARDEDVEAFLDEVSVEKGPMHPGSDNRDDAEELRAGLRRALRILVAAGAAEVGTHRSDGLRLRCKGVRDADVEAFLDEVTIEKGPMYPGSDKWAIFCSAHQMGSCRMGASPRDGAVDGAGESWEAEGLYVCDGSLLPTAVGVNPMITIQSIAYCLSNGIADTLSY